MPDVNIEDSVCFQDLLFLKASFDAYCCHETPEDKQRLLESSRTILEIDTRLYTRLKEQYSKKRQGFSRCFFPDQTRRSDFSKPNITFLSKALGGFFLVHAELEDEDEILERAAMMVQEALNREIRKKHEI